MQICVLGPVQVHDEQAVAAAGRGETARGVGDARAAGRIRCCPTEALIDGLWGADRHRTARSNALQGYVSRLRKTLNRPAGSIELERRSPGYLLTVEPRSVDLQVFEDLTAQAQAVGAARPGGRRPAGSVRRSRLWRGDPLAEFTDEPFTLIEARCWRERRLAALIALMDTELAAGRHIEVIGELTDLANQHPLNERLPGQLMTAPVSRRPAGRGARGLPSGAPEAGHRTRRRAGR